MRRQDARQHPAAGGCAEVRRVGHLRFRLELRPHARRKISAAALRPAKKFIAQLDAEVVPLRDFRLPAGTKPLRDAAVAATAVCGFQELAKLGAADHQIVQVKGALLDKICSAKYLDFNPAWPGVQKHRRGGWSGSRRAEARCY